MRRRCRRKLHLVERLAPDSQAAPAWQAILLRCRNHPDCTVASLALKAGQRATAANGRGRAGRSSTRKVRVAVVGAPDWRRWRVVHVHVRVVLRACDGCRSVVSPVAQLGVPNASPTARAGVCPRSPEAHEAVLPLSARAGARRLCRSWRLNWTVVPVRNAQRVRAAAVWRRARLRH